MSPAQESGGDPRERARGVEPPSSAWKAVARPLSYTREFPGPRDARDRIAAPAGRKDHGVIPPAPGDMKSGRRDSPAYPAERYSPGRPAGFLCPVRRHARSGGAGNCTRSAPLESRSAKVHRFCARVRLP